MFASPFSAPQPASPVRHVFGRFLPRPDPQECGGAVETLSIESPSAEDDAFPDLAQRVREVGEW